MWDGAACIRDVVYESERSTAAYVAIEYYGDLFIP